MNIGVVIKEVRKQKGLTQLDLSEHANLSVRTIQRIENNEVEPRRKSKLGIIFAAFVIVETLAALGVLA